MLMQGTRQPDTTEADGEFGRWPAGSYGRCLTEGGDLRSWIVRTPCGCLSAIRASGVVEYEDGTATVLGVVSCRHGTSKLERGTWRGM